MKNKNLEPTNSNGERHGYQECYWSSGKIMLRVTYKHGNPIGYKEFHTSKITTFHIR